MTVVMYDSIDLSQFPPNPPAVAGYVGGHWPTYPELVKKFPNAHHLSIAVTASQNARCLDVEPGDATPEQAPGWFANHADHSQGTPVLYTSASGVQHLINVMTNAGYARNRYLVWSAHYTFYSHICSPGTCGYPTADATQWTDKSGGKNLDESLCSDAFFGASPSPIPVPEGTVSISCTQNEDGRLAVFVHLQTGEVKHCEQEKPNSEWWKNKDGTYKWLSLGNPGK